MSGESGNRLVQANDYHQRETSTCPVCSGTIREMRNDDKWLCDDCARYWESEEIEP